MFEKEQSVFEKLYINKMKKLKLCYCLFSKWYFNSNKKLNLIESYKIIPKISKVSFIELTKFEKICVKVTKLDCDINSRRVVKNRI